jgi:hypothetical protein
VHRLEAVLQHGAVDLVEEVGGVEQLRAAEGADRASRGVRTQHADAELRLVEALPGDPLRRATLRRSGVEGVGDEAQGLVQGEDELAARRVVADDDEDREHREEEARRDRPQQDARQAQLHRAPQLGVVAGGRAGAVRVPEEAVPGFRSS